MALVLQPPRLGAGTGFEHCRVLVIDPSILIRRIVADILRDLKVEAVQVCATLAQAIHLLPDGHFNVLFIDWSSQMDALSFIRSLRAEGNPYRFLPVVVMTANGDLPSVAAARDAGATEFMLKPFPAVVMASRLRSITQHPRLFIKSGEFFGPDRRRRRDEIAGTDRRRHENCNYADRRHETVSPWNAPERRQGRPSFHADERRTGSRGETSG